MAEGEHEGEGLDNVIVLHEFKKKREPKSKSSFDTKEALKFLREQVKKDMLTYGCVTGEPYPLAQALNIQKETAKDNNDLKKLVDLFEDGMKRLNHKVEEEKARDNFSIRCPFHDGKKRSCMVFPNNNGFHCFVCEKKGNIRELLEQIQNQQNG